MKRIIVALVAPMVLILATITPAMSEESPTIDLQANELLQQMSDFLSTQEHFTFHSENSNDELQASGQLIQYARGVDVAVKRPDKMAAEVNGDLRTMKFYFNGDKVVLHDVVLKFYAELVVPPTLEKALPFAAENFSLDAPLAQFVYPRPYDYLIKGVTEGRYLGIHRVLGIPCHHLAFRTAEVDWQIWIDAGDQPLPRKFVSTEKRVTGAPQFTALLTNWNLDPSLDDKTFRFKKPEGVVQIDFLPAPGLTLP